jgi:asparagine synthase (glutamine-hydrolysing)
VAAKYLPEAVVWREKRGMGVPTSEWCLGPLKAFVAQTLHPTLVKRQGLFNIEYIKKLLRGEDEPGEFRRRRVGEKIWALLMLQIWLTEHNIA